MFEYEKTLLYIYPKMGYLQFVYRELADTKIVTSVKNTDRCEKIVEEILDCIAIKEAIERLKVLIDGILCFLTEDEKCILEYRYFRRKELLNGKYAGYEFSCSYTSFLRKSKAVTKKFSLLLNKCGYTKQKFEEEFKRSDLIMKIFYKIIAKEDVCYLRGKAHSFIFKQK